MLVDAIPPLMLKTDANPDGVPIEVFDEIRASVLSDRSQFYEDLSLPFYGGNREGSTLSQGVRDAFWLMSMQAGLKGLRQHQGFLQTDFSEDLQRFDIPTLIVHGEDDQNVPIANSALKSSKIVPNAELKIYPGAPHGLTVTHKDQFDADLLAFLRS